MSKSIRLEVSVDDQRLDVLKGKRVVRTFQISTAEKGVGFREGSYRTPTGRFRIAEKIGGGERLNTIFTQRVADGIWKRGEMADRDLVLTRVLRIRGLDRKNSNTFDRYIYIHGTNHEKKIGQPASWGCLRLRNKEMVELFDLVEEGTELIIHPPVKPGGKLMFFDCDSTLSSIEGIDELARARGPEIFGRVVALTDAAMNGEIALDQVFPKRMEIIQPDAKTCRKVAAKYIKTVVPGAAALVEKLKKDGWTVVILSGGFAPLIEPLANHLGIKYVEAVPLHLQKGKYAGYGKDYPTTRNRGKNEIIREWKQALRPTCVVMMGDGISDLETKKDVDAFIAFTGVVERKQVVEKADDKVSTLTDPRILDILNRAAKKKDKRRDEISSKKISKFNLPQGGPSLDSGSMSTNNKKATKGKRYSNEEKNEILNFVHQYNNDNGRGGQSAASKKFGISQLTIASWLKSGPEVAGKRGRGVAAVKVKGGSYSAKLSSLAALAAQIDKAESDLAKLKSKFQTLKADI